jgi:hypothetical protein
MASLSVKTPRYRLEGEALMSERELGAPAIGAEPAIRIGSGEVK